MDRLLDPNVMANDKPLAEFMASKDINNILLEISRDQRPHKISCFPQDLIFLSREKFNKYLTEMSKIVKSKNTDIPYDDRACFSFRTNFFRESQYEIDPPWNISYVMLSVGTFYHFGCDFDCFYINGFCMICADPNYVYSLPY